jgi:hypothetical protein
MPTQYSTWVLQVPLLFRSRRAVVLITAQDKIKKIRDRNAGNMGNKIVEKVYSFEVDAAGELYSKKFDLDKNVALVRGIILSSDRSNLLYYRGSQRIEISGDEIFPEDYESKLLMSGISVPPDQRFRSLGDGVIAGNGVVKIQFKDSGIASGIAFAPYKVIIILQCEMR